MANAVIPRYFIDETSIPLGQALAIVREDVVYPGHPAIPGIPAGTIDEEWIPKVGARASW